MTTSTHNHSITGRIDIHKGDMVCFIPCRDWLELDHPPAANMWRDRNNRIWAGMSADDLLRTNVKVDIPLGDLRHIEWTGRGHGFVQDLVPVVFDDGVRQTKDLIMEKRPEHANEKTRAGPRPGM